MWLAGGGLFGKNSFRSFRNNAVRVYSGNAVISPFDVVKIYRVSNSRDVVQTLQVSGQAGIVNHTAQITFEQSVIGNVKANKRDKGPPITFGNALAQQIRLTGKPLFHFVETAEHSCDRFLVGFL